VLGKKVAVLVDEYQGAGNYSLVFNAGNLSSGTYIYALETAGGNLVKKMSFVK
jgi:hypothetical protein